MNLPPFSVPFYCLLFFRALHPVRALHIAAPDHAAVGRAPHKLKQSPKPQRPTDSPAKAWAIVRKAMLANSLAPPKSAGARLSEPDPILSLTATTLTVAKSKKGRRELCSLNSLRPLFWARNTIVEQAEGTMVGPA